MKRYLSLCLLAFCLLFGLSGCTPSHDFLYGDYVNLDLVGALHDRIYLVDYDGVKVTMIQDNQWIDLYPLSYQDDEPLLTLDQINLSAETYSEKFNTQELVAFDQDILYVSKYHDQSGVKKSYLTQLHLPTGKRTHLMEIPFDCHHVYMQDQTIYLSEIRVNDEGIGEHIYHPYNLQLQPITGEFDTKFVTSQTRDEQCVYVYKDEKQRCIDPTTKQEGPFSLDIPDGAYVDEIFKEYYVYSLLNEDRSIQYLVDRQSREVKKTFEKEYVVYIDEQGILTYRELTLTHDGKDKEYAIYTAYDKQFQKINEMTIQDIDPTKRFGNRLLENGKVFVYELNNLKNCYVCDIKEGCQKVK